jgi:hypothetical protein
MSNHPIIEQIGRRDRGLAIVKLGASNLGVGIDVGLLVDAANALQIAEAFSSATPAPRSQHQAVLGALWLPTP